MEVTLVVMVQYLLFRTCLTPRAPRHVHLLCTDGRAAQCNGLQIRKTVGSNPTRCSKQSLPSVTVAHQTPNLRAAVRLRGGRPKQHGFTLCKPSCTVKFFRPLVKWISSLSSKQWVEVRFLHGRPNICL
jgi:hypothetical protein